MRRRNSRIFVGGKIENEKGEVAWVWANVSFVRASPLFECMIQWAVRQFQAFELWSFVCVLLVFFLRDNTST